MNTQLLQDQIEPYLKHLIDTASAKDVRFSQISENFRKISDILHLDKLAPDQLEKFYDHFFYIVSSRLRKLSNIAKLENQKRIDGYFKEIVTLQKHIIAQHYE